MMWPAESLPLQRVAAEGVGKPIVEPVVVRAHLAKSEPRKREPLSQVYARVVTFNDDDDDGDSDSDSDSDDSDDDDDYGQPPQKGIFPTPQRTTMVETLTVPTTSRLYIPPPTPTLNSPFRQPPPSSTPTIEYMTVTTTIVSTYSSMSMAELMPASALAESQTSDSTIFVTLAPTPPPQPFMPHNGGLSEPTQHALIAVGSIGATVIVMILIWIFVRKQQGMRFSEAAYLKRRDRYRTIEEVTPPLGRWSAAGREWDRKPALDAESVHERTMEAISGLPSRPSATVSRSNSATAKLRKADGRRPSDANSENWPMPPNKAPSAVASSVTMPPNAHVGGGDDSIYDQEETNSSMSSLPTYLKGARNIPPRRVLETSRFSWTNSQAPRTPATVSAAGNGDAIGYTRYSVATTRSSVARFRTVDSWVGNQAGRIDEESIQEYIQRYGPQMPTEPVPDMPKHFQTSGNKQTYKAKHHTNLSDATIFNQHPGTKLVIPRTSTVPSDILDGQVMVRKGRDDESI